MKKTAIIIGAGPAGLTAAYELLTRTDYLPIVLEASGDIGGISKTVVYQGNRMDIGGHRFFSKSQRVMDFWMDLAPPDGSGRVQMLKRSRLSRILFLRKFFDYPVKLNGQTLKNLGAVRVVRIGFSYLFTMLHKMKPEDNLEAFYVNRFGRELYNTFFRDYTRKVWGVPCAEIAPDWGAQRVKGLSVLKTVTHALKEMLHIKSKNVETSLIDSFYYPRFGPGQMWEELAQRIEQHGGQVLTHQKVIKLTLDGKRVKEVQALDVNGVTQTYGADLVFSTMPIRELGEALDAPREVREVTDGLIYRNFRTAGLLLKKMNLQNVDGSVIKDNWIYIQEPDVKVGRMQLFHNWSPDMVQDKRNLFIGLEYFCDEENDPLWTMSDEDFEDLAIAEMVKLSIIGRGDVVGQTSARMPKSYPCYFGTYNRFESIRPWFDSIENLYLVGRNGMHRYNNSDHSILTAMVAVDNIVAGNPRRDNIWSVNTESDYHEAEPEAVKQQSVQQEE